MSVALPSTAFLEWGIPFLGLEHPLLVVISSLGIVGGEALACLGEEAAAQYAEHLLYRDPGLRS